MTLIERLRAPAFWFCESNEGHPGDATALVHEAADRLSVMEEALERRRNIYLVKRDKFDLAADDTETPWERYDFAAEVVEWVASDLGIELPERPEDAGAALAKLEQD